MMDEDQYLVSICVPIYGVEKYIKRCAISLFEQTYNNIEYLFINDCTNDASIDILRQTMNLYPQRIPQVQIIEHQHNKGLAGARNTAVSAATGDFIMHVDGDDYVDRNIVSKAVIKQKESNADIVIIDFIQKYSDFQIYVKYPCFEEVNLYCLNVLARNIPNSIWAKLIRRSLYVDNAIRCKEGCDQGEDFQVVPQLLYHAKIINNLNTPLYIYNCSNQTSYTKNFSISRYTQNWESVNIIVDYFADKGKEYLYAIQDGIAKYIANDFIISVKTSGKVSACYYTCALTMLSKLEREHWKSVPTSKRIIFYLSKNFQIMKVYILAARILRKTISKFNYCIKNI